jgi:DeoR family fructose operon transcriptional repressor
MSVTDLARALDVSSITVHRDLDALANDGLVERVYGGARPVTDRDAFASIPPTGWAHRAAHARDAKLAIAAHAARVVRSGSTIFLDSSTTALALARHLVTTEASHLTIVTNSPVIASEVVSDRIMLIAAPGELDQHMRLLAGRWTTDFLSSLNFEVAFCSAAGLTLEAGLTTSRRALAEVINVARANAERTFGLIDSTKFGRASLTTIAQAQDFDVIVTDDGLSASVREEYLAAGVRLEIAEPEPPAG